MGKLDRKAAQYAAKATSDLRVTVSRKVYTPINAAGKELAKLMGPLQKSLAEIDKALAPVSKVRKETVDLVDSVVGALKLVAEIFPYYLTAGYRTGVTAIRQTDDFLIDLSGVSGVNVPIWKAVLASVGLGLFALVATRNLFAS